MTIDRSEFYQTLEAAGTPYVPPGKWAKQPGSDSFRWVNADAAQLAMRPYGVADLTDAGIICGEGLDGSSPLVSSPTLLWFTRRVGDEKPYQVIANMRGLGSHVAPWGAVLQDERFIESMKLTDKLVLAARMTDCAILASAGIAALPATGWHNLGGKGLEILVRELRALSQSTWPPIIALLGWNVEEVEQRKNPYLARVANHLRTINEHLELGLILEWWLPSPAQLSALEVALEFGFGDHAKELLACSLSDDIIADWEVAGPPPADVQIASPAALCDAVRQLHASQGQADATERRKAYQRFQQSIKTLVTEPLLSRAQAEADPSLRAHFLGMAAVKPMVITELHLLFSRLTSGPVDPRAIGATLSDAQLDRLCKLLEAVSADPKGPAANARKK